ncbi:hypothetical protein [Methylophaga sp. SB9B]|uniref:hypothetical protein n=1 Tax=Methylophaga sp. SB9B TaxID=2570356 RepID=UPI001FFF5C6E|nr:hypothetical protein [Methylophaga sp. SB9B]
MPLLILLLFILIPWSARASADALESYVIQQVSEGVYYHQGVHQEADSENLGQSLTLDSLLAMNV